MKKRRIRYLVAVLAALPLLLSAQPLRWYKGNTHMHSNQSDGDETRRRAARWYFDHDYNFIVMTDHDRLTPTADLYYPPQEEFIVIPGEELTTAVRRKPVHVCGINMAREMKPGAGSTCREVLQNSLTVVVAAGGLAQINHPNWRRGLCAADMKGVTHAALLEVYNVNRVCNNFAAGGQPGMEQVWDELLSSGMRIYGVASDDTHNYLGDFLPAKSPPGLGWVMVRAQQLTPEAITEALGAGDFYATTGIILRDVRRGEKEYALEIEPEEFASYSVFFIGRDGRVLREVHGTSAAYAVRGDEGYVRARVVSSGGELALTQPFFVDRTQE